MKPMNYDEKLFDAGRMATAANPVLRISSAK
jgi:hypothetical protein